MLVYLCSTELFYATRYKLVHLCKLLYLVSLTYTIVQVFIQTNKIYRVSLIKLVFIVFVNKTGSCWHLPSNLSVGLNAGTYQNS